MTEPEFEDEPAVVVIENKPAKEEPEVFISEEPELGWDEPVVVEKIVQIEPETVQNIPQERKPLNHVMRIQILRRELGLTDEQYRTTLEKSYGVTSSKDLTQEQAAEVIERLTLALSKKKGN
jgi:hypothetical protein